jgi:hypothetical protein
VEKYDAVIGGEPQVALDSHAQLERRSESDQAVLGESGAVMEPPVSKSGGTRIERIRA